MTPFVFSIVLASALLHATWNAFLRASKNRFVGMFVLAAVQSGFAGLFIIAMGLPFPKAEAWVWLGASVMFHLGYMIFLTMAYERGDLSRVYPIARGSAPLMTALISGTLLDENITPLQYCGIVFISFGILNLIRDVRDKKENISLVPFALLSASFTCGYTLSDGLGARANGDASAFLMWMFVLDFLPFAAFAFATNKITPTEIRLGISAHLVGAGVLSLLGYWVVVWAMTKAPIPLVAGVRETSVLFAIMIGVFFLREKFSATKLLSGALIVSGLIALKI